MLERSGLYIFAFGLQRRKRGKKGIKRVNANKLTGQPVYPGKKGMDVEKDRK